MPKAYIIGRSDVHNPEAYQSYVELTKAAFEKYGAKALVRGGKFEALEGDARSRNIVLEFEDYDTAREYFYSTEYQTARDKRLGAADIELVLVEGTE